MENIISMYNNIDIWLLIFCRIFFAIIFLSVIVETGVPNIAKVGLSMILASLVYFTLSQPEVQYNLTILGFGMLVLKETLVGLIIGFGVNLFFQVYYFVGSLLSTQGGLGMSNLFDPVNGTQMPLIGKFYHLAFCAVFLASGGYHWFIKALVETFTYMPINSAIFRTDIVGSIVIAIGVFWEISFKIAAPIIAILFIIDCGLGILARTVPQMNMFVIGLPLKVMILLVMLLITMQLLPTFNNMIINNITDTFFNLLQGMRP